jgi:hypothetical protein
MNRPMLNALDDWIDDLDSSLAIMHELDLGAEIEASMRAAWLQKRNLLTAVRAELVRLSMETASCR